MYNSCTVYRVRLRYRAYAHVDFINTNIVSGQYYNYRAQHSTPQYVCNDIIEY